MQQRTGELKVQSRVLSEATDDMQKFDYVQWQRRTVSAAAIANDNASSLSSASKGFF